jgi:hypothetical protein
VISRTITNFKRVTTVNVGENSLNLSILVRERREDNNDSPSNGE